jgi:hypothetical protein
MDTKRAPPGTFGSLPDFEAWLRRAPGGCLVKASEVAEILAEMASEARQERREPETLPDTRPEPWTWRERLWTVPAETRLGVAEVAEALSRPKSYVYARTGPKAEDPLPHRKLDGALFFTAGELRTWIRDQEEEVAGVPMTSTLEERRVRVL